MHGETVKNCPYNFCFSSRYICLLLKLHHYLYQLIFRSLSILTQYFAQFPSPITSNSHRCKPTDNNPVCPNIWQDTLPGLSPYGLWSSHLGGLFSDVSKLHNGLIFKSLMSNFLSTRHQTLEDDSDTLYPNVGQQPFSDEGNSPRRIRTSTARL